MKLFKWIYKRFITRGDLLRVQTRFERACDATQREAALFWVRDTISFRNLITDSLKKGTHNDAVWSSRTNKAPPAMDTPISRTHTHLGGSPSRSRNLHANIACATPSQVAVFTLAVCQHYWHDGCRESNKWTSCFCFCHWFDQRDPFLGWIKVGLLEARLDTKSPPTCLHCKVH